jgi:hypothetical protein
MIRARADHGARDRALKDGLLVERFLETNHMLPCRKVAFHKENAHLRRSADMIRIKEALY